MQCGSRWVTKCAGIVLRILHRQVVGLQGIAPKSGPWLSADRGWVPSAAQPRMRTLLRCALAAQAPKAVQASTSDGDTVAYIFCSTLFCCSRCNELRITVARHFAFTASTFCSDTSFQRNMFRRVAQQVPRRSQICEAQTNIGGIATEAACRDYCGENPCCAWAYDFCLCGGPSAGLCLRL